MCMWATWESKCRIGFISLGEAWGPTLPAGSMMLMLVGKGCSSQWKIRIVCLFQERLFCGFFGFLKFFFNVYLFLRQRETEHEQGRGRERGRHWIWNRLQALSCQPRARRGAWTHGPGDRDLSWSRTLNRLSHPGAPIEKNLNEHVQLSKFVLIV